MTNPGTDNKKADSLSITLGKDDKDTSKEEAQNDQPFQQSDAAKKDAKAKPPAKKDDKKGDDDPTWDEKYPDGVEVAPHSDEPRDDAYPPGRAGKLQALADRYDSDAALKDKQNWGTHEVHYNASTAQLLRELAEV